MGSLLHWSYSVSSLFRGRSRFNFACRSNYEVDVLDIESRWVDRALRICAHIWSIPSNFSSNSIIPFLKAHQPYFPAPLCCLQRDLDHWSYLWHSSRAPAKDYTVLGDHQDRVFGAFNAIAIIATTYGNGIIPEIQATAAPPVTGKMFKGLCLCYAVAVATFFSVSISGYWAFGNQAHGSILTNFIVDNTTLVPKWLLMSTNIFTLLQLSTVSVTLWSLSAQGLTSSAGGSNGCGNIVGMS